MAGYIPDQQQNTGSQIPTTQVWSIGEIYAANLDPKLQELFLRLYQQLGLMSDSVNKKDFAYYLNEELVDGQSYFNTTASAGHYVTNDEMNLRPNFRKVFNCGAIAPGANTIAHGLTIGSTWKFTRIYGVANDPTGHHYYPLPWADAVGGGANNIQLDVDATNINITNNTAITFASCTVVLEYCKY